MTPSQPDRRTAARIATRLRLGAEAGRRLLTVAAVLAIAGCAAKPKTNVPLVQSADGSVMYGTFVTQGEARLSPETPLRGLYAVGDSVFAYTESNVVYALAPGLELRFLRQVVPSTETLRPPVQVGEEVIFPSNTTMLSMTKQGEPIRTIQLRHPLTSDVHVDQRGLLLAGLATRTGGRVAVIDPQKEFRPETQQTLIGNVLSAPVALQGIVFAATDQGRVFAISPENTAAWSMEGMSFDTNRPIEADLVIDDYALYVASTDYKLYALDRGTGKIKWRYVAETSLRQSPFVTADRVYQVVPGKGLVSINKLDGKLYREPLWVASGVTEVVTVDDRYVYALQGDRKLVAIGVQDGQVKFSATGTFDFVSASGDSIFAASRDGRIVRIRRGTYTGDQPAVAASRY